MDRSLPHIPRPRSAPGAAPGLSREYTHRLGRLSAAVVLAGALLDPDDLELDLATDFLGFGVSE